MSENGTKRGSTGGTMSEGSAERGSSSSAVRSGTIRVGTAGWSYPDWRGFVYPSGRPAGFDPLAFMARHFDVIEINSSFYRPLSPRLAAAWPGRVSVNPRFVFTAKLWQGFTHDPAHEHRQEEAAYRKGLEPLVRAGLLSCVLMQFPHSFRPTGEGRRTLASLIERFSGFRLVVELRRADWHRPAIREWLTGLGVAICRIDQPRVGRGGGATAGPPDPSETVTGPLAYVRMHGRNARAWFGRESDRNTRYDYLYPAAELEPWIGRIRAMAAQAEEVHVIMNNHFRGKAAVNALMIRAMLDAGEDGDGHAPSGRVEAPPELLAAYPELAVFAKAPPQGRLFP